MTVEELDILGKYAIRARETAKVLSISERSLFTLTKAGLIPHVRVGRSVLYPVAALRQWLEDRSRESQSVGSPKSVQPESDGGRGQ